MERNPLFTLIINTVLVVIIFIILYFLEKFHFLETRSARIYFLIALVLALIDFLVTSRVDQWLKELKNKD